ncbi:hypothetical protein [Streptomyces qinzhouensis]|uniref:Uncharacterized protein n=1 Tax=Streptomyces qinzhouensis TaxID=2599401 RepID=A0A5B8J2Z5_9ACTN|nr:hypothetical protein [Streptomyces qinzhouensis]QDY75577.1 hypothetical protein FQU76_02580 [Streptomyces qinzhouensis]
MLTDTAYEETRLSLWRRVREFAVPPSMIETATARRAAGDWAGSCAAAGFDVDFRMPDVNRDYGGELTARLRADLRRLAPDLLRWHMPRIAPDGRLRPGLTVALARYGAAARDGTSPLYLVARTPPAWADAGQRIGLALWDPSSRTGTGRDPHPRPNPRFRLDLHRHLWAADRSGELRSRGGSGPGGPPRTADPQGLVPAELLGAAHRWAEEAALLLRADGLPPGPVVVRLGSRRRLVLRPGPGASPGTTAAGRISVAGRRATGLPALPEAAVRVPPDVELLRAGLVGAEQLHPLVAAALVPGYAPTRPAGTSDAAERARLVECRGELHRIGLVDGVLKPLDHDAAEIRREELLVALEGPPLPCLRAVDEAHRSPHCLDDVRERLIHGDVDGALAVVRDLLGPEALPRHGPLRDTLLTAAARRIDHGLFRAGPADRTPSGDPSHVHGRGLVRSRFRPRGRGGR